MKKGKRAGILILVLCIWGGMAGCSIPGKSGNLQNVLLESEKESENGEEKENTEKDNTGVEKENTEKDNTGVEKEKAVEENGARVEAAAEPDIGETIQEILENARKELVGSYRVDDSFLLWMAGQYGKESVYALQQEVRKDSQQMECWYEITGKSLHVLWVEYCWHTGLWAYDTEKVYEKECADEEQVVLDFTGDINLAEGWSTTEYLDSQSGGIRDCFSAALLEEMQSADILMINNEFTFSNRGTPLAGKTYTFRADPERINVMKELGADVLSLANNHVYDYGEEALLDTLTTIEQARIPVVGAGRNLEEAMKPVYFIANGRKIAIVAATQIERSTNYTKEATDSLAGVLKTLNPDKFVSVIQKARARSDYVIAFVHWGTENTNDYGSDQVELGRTFVEAGANVVIGGHTHCLQGFDYYNGKPVIYSLGNFWFNNKTVDTGLSQVVIHTDSGKIDFRFLPCIQQECVTSLVEDSQERQRILDFMQRISAPGVQVNSDGTVTEVP